MSSVDLEVGIVQILLKLLLKVYWGMFKLGNLDPRMVFEVASDPQIANHEVGLLGEVAINIEGSFSVRPGKLEKATYES